MTYPQMGDFYLVDWNEIDDEKGDKLSGIEKYKRLVSWAGKARSQNPGVFDELTGWILDDSQWSDDQLAENEQILMQGVLARFKQQNSQLRVCLKELEPAGVAQECDDFELAVAIDVPDVEELTPGRNHSRTQGKPHQFFGLSVECR